MSYGKTRMLSILAVPERKIVTADDRIVTGSVPIDDPELGTHCKFRVTNIAGA